MKRFGLVFKRTTFEGTIFVHLESRYFTLEILDNIVINYHVLSVCKRIISTEPVLYEFILRILSWPQWATSLLEYFSFVISRGRIFFRDLPWVLHNIIICCIIFCAFVEFASLCELINLYITSFFSRCFRTKELFFYFVWLWWNCWYHQWIIEYHLSHLALFIQWFHLRTF